MATVASRTCGKWTSARIRGSPRALCPDPAAARDRRERLRVGGRMRDDKSFPPVSPAMRGYERWPFMFAPIVFHMLLKTAVLPVVDACEIAMREQDFGDHRRVARHEVDHARRKPCRFAAIT
jgi:hypothetical protein